MITPRPHSRLKRITIESSCRILSWRLSFGKKQENPENTCVPSSCDVPCTDKYIACHLRAQLLASYWLLATGYLLLSSSRLIGLVARLVASLQLRTPHSCLVLSCCSYPLVVMAFLLCILLSHSRRPVLLNNVKEWAIVEDLAPHHAIAFLVLHTQ